MTQNTVSWRARQGIVREITRSRWELSSSSTSSNSGSRSTSLKATRRQDKFKAVNNGGGTRSAIFVTTAHHYWSPLSIENKSRLWPDYQVGDLAFHHGCRAKSYRSPLLSRKPDEYPSTDHTPKSEVHALTAPQFRSVSWSTRVFQRRQRKEIVLFLSELATGFRLPARVASCNTYPRLLSLAGYSSDSKGSIVAPPVIHGSRITSAQRRKIMRCWSFQQIKIVFN